MITQRSLEKFEADTSPDPLTGMSTIHRACIEGDSEKVRAVFSLSPGLMDTTIALRSAVETPSSPYRGKTASEIAKMFDSQEHRSIVELLKEYGNGTESRSLIYMAARIGTLRHLKRLYKRDTDLNESSRNKEDGCSTLLNLAAENNTREVIQWLVSQGADPHKRDVRGFNPVHCAAISGREEIVRYFLDFDESLLFSRSEGGLTILHLAAWGGHALLVEFLLSQGMDINCASNHEGGLDDSDVESADTEILELGQETREFAHWVNEGTTPVMMAAASGHVNIVKLLVSKGADLHARDNENRNCLFFAVRGRHDSVVQYLIDAGLDIQNRDVEGRSLLHLVSSRSTALLLIEHGIQPGARDETEKIALHHAAIRGDVEVAKLLIELGEDINARDVESLTPLDCAINDDACFSSCFERLPFLTQTKNDFSENTKALINSRRQKIAQLLINSGCEIEVAVENQTTSLHHAVKFDIETVKLLVKSGASVNATDENGRSPLHEAASVGKTETIRYLLMQGANINAADKEGMTPLLEAADAPGEDAFKILLENGASINVANTAGDTALHLAARGESLNNVELLLNYASRQSSDEVESSSVLSLLNKTNKKGKTALFEAAKNGDRKTLTVLLERGSVLGIHDAKKRTILHAAASARNSDALKFLMKQRDLNVNQADVNGDTALHLAVQKNLYDNVRILLHQIQPDDMDQRDDAQDALKCDVNAKNKKHRTPLHIAARDNYTPEILQILIKCGGNTAAADKLFNLPLHYAAGNRFEIVKALVQTVNGDAERDIVRCANAKNSKGRSPLHEGARRNEKGIVALLLDTGSHVNAVDQFKRTSLHYAAVHHSSDTVKVLVRRGADMNAVDQDGNTPLHAAAAEYSQGPCVRFLRQQGSNMEAQNKDGLSPDSILRNKAARRSSLFSCSESESSSDSEESDSD